MTYQKRFERSSSAPMLLVLTLLFMVVVFSPAGNLMAQTEFEPGDAVQILLFPDTTSALHNLYPIDGFIFLPLVGKVKITAMSSDQLVGYLRDNFQQYLKSPNIQVRPLMRLGLIGGFHHPGFYYVDRKQTLWQLMHNAGGPVLEEGLSMMVWEREGKIVQEDLIDLVESRKSFKDLGFRSGDQIRVRNPEQPDFWERARQITPVLTLFLTAYLASQAN